MIKSKKRNSFKHIKKSLNKMKILRVGTDCSGIEAPIQALEQMKIPFKHVFSSEIDKYCIESIKANYNPEIIFGDKDGPCPEGDITKRNINDVPNIDLYVCGFPCQPFSSAGKQKGLNDKRGYVFFSCLEVIRKKQPKYFILENVKNLQSHDKGNTWNIIWSEILKLKKYKYIVKYKILNTRDYGIPQNRERIFIIGSKTDFDFPLPIKNMNNLQNYVDWNIKSNIIPNYIKSHIEIVPKNGIFIDCSFPKHTYPNSPYVCSTITTRNRMWCIPLNRFMTIEEALLLQGFPTNFIQYISDTQMYKQIGNSISVNVLKKIFIELL